MLVAELSCTTIKWLDPESKWYTRSRIKCWNYNTWPVRKSPRPNQFMKNLTAFYRTDLNYWKQLCVSRSSNRNFVNCSVDFHTNHCVDWSKITQCSDWHRILNSFGFTFSSFSNWTFIFHFHSVESNLFLEMFRLSFPW